MTTTLPKRVHRTVLFVDGESLKSSSAYRERVERLNKSLNGSNIKVDVLTVAPAAPAPVVPHAGIVAGLVTDAPAPAPATDGGFVVDDLVDQAAAAGYTMTLVAIPTSK